MDIRWEDLKERLKELAGSWPGYVTLGSFALYLLGYLCIRFHLTVLGIGTDLKVLDERYLFAGAKFLVYLFATIASVVLIAIVFSPVIALCVYLLKRWEPLRHTTTVVLVLGILLTVGAIQFVMKQCFEFSNLLLARELPWTGLNLGSLFLEERDTLRPLYFVFLVAVTALSASILLYVNKRVQAASATRPLVVLFAFLVGVQFLLLPVNYGVFIMDKQTPKVASFGDRTPLAADQEAWLVWEGDQGVTYLVRGPEADPGAATARLRRLVTLPKGEVKRTEIIRYDSIFARIFEKK